MSIPIVDAPINRALKAGLDVAALNQRLISDNIANVDTPGYKGLRLDFDDYFKEAKNLLGEEKFNPTNPYKYRLK